MLSTGEHVAPAPIEDASASSEVVEQCMVAEEFTGDDDLLTPTLKKKRRSIHERYADLVADAYAEAEQEVEA